MFSCLVVSNSFATPWTVACQVLLCMGFRRQEYWNGLPFPSPEDLPDPGIEPTSPALADRFFTTETSRKPHIKGGCVCVIYSVVSNSLQPHGLQPARLLCPWDSPGKITRVDCHSLLQRIFPTQGLNPGLLHCRQILYHLSYREVLTTVWNSLLTRHRNPALVLRTSVGIRSSTENTDSLSICLSTQSYGLQPARHIYPWDSPGKNTGVDAISS